MLEYLKAFGSEERSTSTQTPQVEEERKKNDVRFSEPNAPVTRSERNHKSICCRNKENTISFCRYLVFASTNGETVIIHPPVDPVMCGPVGFFLLWLFLVIVIFIYLFVSQTNLCCCWRKRGKKTKGGLFLHDTGGWEYHPVCKSFYRRRWGWIHYWSVRVRYRERLFHVEIASATQIFRCFLGEQLPENLVFTDLPWFPFLPRCSDGNHNWDWRCSRRRLTQHRRPERWIRPGTLDHWLCSDVQAGVRRSHVTGPPEKFRETSKTPSVHVWTQL